MDVCQLCQGTGLPAPQRRIARSCTNRTLQPIRCFKTSETGTSNRQLNSNPESSGARRYVAQRIGGLFLLCVSSDQQENAPSYDTTCAELFVLTIALSTDGYRPTWQYRCTSVFGRCALSAAKCTVGLNWAHKLSILQAHRIT